MMIHHARRRARFSGEDLVLLDDQDRSLWDHAQIAAGRAVLDRAVALGGRGAYVIQAVIASLQTAERIDWPQVAESRQPHATAVTRACASRMLITLCNTLDACCGPVRAAGRTRS